VGEKVQRQIDIPFSEVISLYKNAKIFFDYLYGIQNCPSHCIWLTQFHFKRLSSYLNALIAVLNEFNFVLKVTWAPCHHGMVRPQVADREYVEGSCELSNKQSPTRGGPPVWGFGGGANNSSP
jgi:hypothetical protein